MMTRSSTDTVQSAKDLQLHKLKPSNRWGSETKLKGCQHEIDSGAGYSQRKNDLSNLPGAQEINKFMGLHSIDMKNFITCKECTSYSLSRIKDTTPL